MAAGQPFIYIISPEEYISTEKYAKKSKKTFAIWGHMCYNNRAVKIIKNTHASLSRAWCLRIDP